MTSTTDADRSDPSVRQRWPDVAKGACIVLVVLWHVVLKHYQQIDWHTSVPFSAAWGTLGDQLLPLRMPLFFAVSGLFAASAVTRPWGELLRTRVARFAALYGLWLLIHTAVFAILPAFPTAHATTPLALLAQATISPTNLWYLLALSVYFTMAKATRRLPATWVIGAALLLSAVASAGLVPNENNRWQVLQNLVFFLTALRLRPQVLRFAEAGHAGRTLLLTTGCVLGVASMTLLGAGQWFGVRPLVSLLAASTGIALAAAASRRLRRASTGLAALGRRTLPVYVLHLPVLAGLGAMLAGPLAALEPRGAIGAALDPVVVTATTIACSLLLAALLERVGLGRLLDPLRSRTAHSTRTRAPALVTAASTTAPGTDDVARRPGPAVSGTGA